MKLKIIIFILCIFDAILVIDLLVGNGTVALLTPKGTIAFYERNLMVTAVLVMLAAAIPVFILAFFIAWKYKEGNPSAKYVPDWKLNRYAAVLKWVLPCVVILALALLNWKSTHDLDPYKRLNNTTPPLTVQVVALRWKWLFIYPRQNIATVNFIEIPVNTPVNFELTSDGPMNSFWIPQLGGQIYAMTGMTTQLHLEANNRGDYTGSAAEINGQGFSGMRFTTRASSKKDFDSWVESVQKSSNKLDFKEYENLVKPSENNPAAFYFLADPNLYNKIIVKYMPSNGKKIHSTQ